jgi:hypothetical protein
MKRSRPMGESKCRKFAGLERNSEKLKYWSKAETRTFADRCSCSLHEIWQSQVP